MLWGSAQTFNFTLFFNNKSNVFIVLKFSLVCILRPLQPFSDRRDFEALNCYFLNFHLHCTLLLLIIK